MADVERLGTAPRDVLAALLEAVADAVYLVDPDGRVVFANPAALRALGYEEDELLGRVSHPTIHHSHWDGSPFPQAQCPMLRPRLTGEGSSCGCATGCGWVARGRRRSALARRRPRCAGTTCGR